MTSPTHLSLPRTEQLAIGRQKGDLGSRVGIFERVNGYPIDTLSGLVVNRGITSFVLSCYVGVPAYGSVDLIAQPNDADTIVLDDGPGAAVTFEFDSNASITGDVAVQIGATVNETLENLLVAINASALAITASRGGSAFDTQFDHGLMLLNNVAGTAGNVTATESTSGARIAVTGMVGGTGAVHNLRVAGASVASVTVVPGGRIPFTLELALADVQTFLSFDAEAVAPALNDGVLGDLTLAYWTGKLSRRERFHGADVVTV